MTTDWIDPRKFLSRHGLRPRDSFGQCFLIAPPVVEAIVTALDPRADETVVEIGTGTGTLARRIAPHARRVIAIERDRDLAEALRAEPMGANVELVEDDAAAFDYEAQCAAEPTSIVGNLPYQITGRLLRAITTPPLRWRVAVVMVQHEVALRLLASPNDDDWGVLSIFTQAGCAVRKVISAGPGCFHPAPRVQSTVVALTPLATPRADETKMFQRMVHALFAARRKTLRNGLSSVIPRDRAEAVCASVEIDPGLRPEVLTIEQLAALSRACEVVQAGG